MEASSVGRLRLRLVAKCKLSPRLRLFVQSAFHRFGLNHEVITAVQALLIQLERFTYGFRRHSSPWLGPQISHFGRPAEPSVPGDHRLSDVEPLDFGTSGQKHHEVPMTPHNMIVRT